MREDSAHPYTCGEAECLHQGVRVLTMPAMTAHWRGHQREHRPCDGALSHALESDAENEHLCEQEARQEFVDRSGPSRRIDAHQAACAITARHLVNDGRIPPHAEGYAAALLASRADLAIRDVVAVCSEVDVPGYRLPVELNAGVGDA